MSDVAASAANWLLREEKQLFSRFEVSAQGIRQLRRFHVPLLVVVYALVAFVGQALNGPGADAAAFASAGNTLFSSHWADTFSNSYLQSGPIFILLEGIGFRLGSTVGLPYWCGGGFVTAAAAALLMVVACRALFAAYKLDDRTPVSREFGACVVFAVTGGIWVAAMYAHLDDLLVTLLLVIAAARGASGRHGQAGAIFGVAVGIKLWAVIAVAVLLVCASRRASAQAGVIAAATIALCYGPFIVFGRFAMFRGTWQVEHDAPLNLLFRAGTDVSWQLRLFQAALATIVGLVVLLRTRGHNCAIWLVPAAAIAARLLVDPRNIAYYYPAVLVCLFLGQWASGRLTTFGTSLVTGSWMVVAICIFAATSGVVASCWVVVFCLGIIVFAMRYGSARSAQTG